MAFNAERSGGEAVRLLDLLLGAKCGKSERQTEFLNETRQTWWPDERWNVVNQIAP
jgi:hypothetical protein